MARANRRPLEGQTLDAPGVPTPVTAGRTPCLDLAFGYPDILKSTLLAKISLGLGYERNDSFAKRSNF